MILVHCYFAFMLELFGGCLEVIRRMVRRDRLVRGIKP